MVSFVALELASSVGFVLIGSLGFTPLGQLVDEESNITVSTITDGTVRFFINFQVAAPGQVAKENNEYVIFQPFLLFYIYYHYPR